MSKCHNVQYTDILPREEFMNLFFHTLQTIPDICNSYVPDGLMQNEIYASDVSTHTVRCTYIHKGVQPKSKPQHYRDRLAEALQPHRLCYRPSVLFCHPCLIAFSFPQQQKMWRACKNVILTSSNIACSCVTSNCAIRGMFVNSFFNALNHAMFIKGKCGELLRHIYIYIYIYI